MGLIFTRQVSFAGGEVAPSMWGRTDLPSFAVGLRTCRNLFIEKHGVAMTRPGSTFVAFGQSATAKLIPFVQDDSTSFVCEFSGSGKLAFHQRGAPLLSGGVPYTIAHPYDATSIARLQWAQVGDVLTITHPLYAPMELKRFADPSVGVRSWTLTPAAFANTLTPWWRDTDAGAAVTLGPMIVNVGVLMPVPNGAPISVGGLGGDATHPPRVWFVQATATVQHTATGRTFESLPFTLTQSFDGANGDGSHHADAPLPLPDGNLLAIYPDRPVIYRRATSAGLISEPADANDYRVLAINFFRGPSLKLMGFIGSTTTRDFVDLGAEPDYTLQPAQGNNPFVVLDHLGAVSRVEHPAAVCFFQEKRAFGGTTERGGFVFTSATGNYVDYDEHIVPVSGQALLFELAARRRERINSMVAVNRMLAFTGSTVWSIGGAGGPLDFDSIDARVEEEIGSIGLPPVVMENAVLYARAKGAGVRSLIYDARSQTFQGRDISDVSSHLFFFGETRFPVVGGTGGGLGSYFLPPTGGPVLRSIVDWTYAEDPFRLVWVVRSDGALLSLSYEAAVGADQGHESWARHDTDGLYRSICSVPEGDEDAVYTFVQRAIAGSSSVGCVERFTSRQRRGNAFDDGAVDCGVLRGPISPTTLLDGLGPHLIGRSVYVVSVGNPPYGPLLVTVPDPAKPTDGAVTLPELPAANYDPTGGTTPTLWVGYVGLLFTADLELLDVIGADVRAKQKTLVSITFETDQSRGLQLGQDFDHLNDWEQRDVGNGYLASPAATALVRMPVSGTFELAARACLRQSLPLPLSVLGITREIDIGS